MLIYQRCMAYNPAGIKLVAASHPQVLSLEAVLFKGGRSEGRPESTEPQFHSGLRNRFLNYF